MKTKVLEEILKELDIWLESDEHSFSCASHNEGLNCCLDKSDNYIYGGNGRKKIIELIEKSLTKHTLDKEAPMGVSQWKEHGKKYKYWNFFVEEVLKDLMEEDTGCWECDNIDRIKK